MKTKRGHIQFFTILLLCCMLKVAFPVGEFFHNHHSEKELCTHINGKKCQHSSHFSSVEKHHSCFFFQLHDVFTPFTFTYHFFQVNELSIFFLKEIPTKDPLVESLSRGPPSYILPFSA